MKKLYAASLVMVMALAFYSAQAQQIALGEKGQKPGSRIPKTGSTQQLVPADRCGFDYLMTKAKTRGFDEAAFEAELQRIIQQKKAEGFDFFTGPVTIPVIFHVIYRNPDFLGNTANLSASRFQDQLNQLNLDYANLAGSAYGVASDVSIRFCLALVDTTGRTLTEPGIERINGQSKGWSNTDMMDIGTLIDYFESTIKPATIWDPYSYLNIWSAAMDASGLLGYASFPGLSTLAGLDNTETNTVAGVAVSWRSVGSVANPNPMGAPYNLGRTLTHELGHFFGLRHIWGDDFCGNDYCSDTPPQDDASIGCPTPGSLNNCSPSGPKMFENYMDYSDDPCMNTFTANQAFRCQTVMDNSPRRWSLINSKACVARPGNAIAFSSAAPFAVSETGNAGNCPNTKSYTFNLYVANQASGAATVSFTGSGTAQLGQDYTFSPAFVTYALNDNSAKTITITINDDQSTEPVETIIMGYTISGAGVAAGPDKQTITINITDNDISNVSIDNLAPAATILSQNFDASANIPAGWTTEIYGDGFSTPNPWVVSSNGGAGTSGNAAHVTNDIVAKPNEYNVDNYSDAYLFSPLIDATGLRDLNLSFKWRCVGEIGYDAGYIGYIPEGEARTAANVRYFNTLFNDQLTTTTANLALPASFSNTKFYFVFNWFNDESLGDNPGFTLDDITFTGKGFTVASTADADTSFSQYSGQTVQFFSKNSASPFDNRLISIITNPNQDLGCVTASITNTGTGLTTLTTNTGAYQRSDKVIKLTPAVSNSSASYQASFYFTTAELAAWGPNVPNLKIMKVQDGVNLNSTFNSSNAQVLPTTVNDLRATRGYASFTASFTGGFSQFFLVSPATTIPVSLLSFTAQAGSRNIILTWATATEINNKGFGIERSTDGVRFEYIGWMNGVGNSTRITNYQYTDQYAQPGVLYHYRLRQTDLDNRETLSELEHARIKASGIHVLISPNPAKDLVKVFVGGTSALADIKLLNAQGQLVRDWINTNVSGSPALLNINGLTKGVYLLKIILPQGILVQKLIID